VDQLQHILGAYDVHRYANSTRVRTGELETYWRTHWDYALEHDPAAKGKPFIVGEAGMHDDAQHPTGNPHIGEYGYGVFMADYAVQAARAGSAAVSAWMLDDNSHKGFFWGLWGNKENGMKLRPWFYPWSLLSRYFPMGSVIYRAAQTSADLRILAARIPAHGRQGGDAWTFCLVNRAEITANVTLRVPGAPALELQRYVYSEKEAPADADGFPTPVATERGVLAKGIAVPCPGNSAVFLTSLPSVSF